MFNENLRKLRLRKGLTQVDLAAKAGINRRYIQDLEAGRKQPTIVVAAKLKSALGCRWDTLLKGL